MSPSLDPLVDQKVEFRNKLKLLSESKTDEASSSKAGGDTTATVNGDEHIKLI